MYLLIHLNHAVTIWKIYSYNNMNNIIFNYGDSQGEILDYVFYNNEDYIKYNEDSRIGWRSGWSTRGLLKEEHQKRLFDPLYEILYNKNKIHNIFIFLTFGSVDIEWNLSYKLFKLKEKINTNNFINEIIVTFDKILKKFIEITNEYNIKNKYNNKKVFIIIVIPFEPLPLSNDYMLKFSKKNNTEFYNILSYKERVNLWNIYANKLKNMIKLNYKEIKVIDLRNYFKDDGYKNYLSTVEDHHPDINKTKDIFIKELNNIEFNNNDVYLKLQAKPYTGITMYDHVRRPL